jgi:putative endonuclease
MFYIYILQSEACSDFYTGYSDDPVRRLYQHNNLPVNSFTSKFRPWRFKAVFSVSEDRGIAMKAERFIKKQKSKKFIETICKKDIVDLPMAQLVRSPESDAIRD